jgi:hypothetical protein
MEWEQAARNQQLGQIVPNGGQRTAIMQSIYGSTIPSNGFLRSKNLMGPHHKFGSPWQRAAGKK